MAHGLPLPADAAHVYGNRAGRSASDYRHPATDAGNAEQLPMGDLPAESRRADARNGHQQRARLSLEHLCGRPSRAPQSWYTPPLGAADGERSAQDRADEQTTDG